MTSPVPRTGKRLLDGWRTKSTFANIFGMKKIAWIVLRLTSSLSVLGAMFYLYGIMPDQDWQPNLEKFLVFLVFFAAIAGFEYLGFRRESPRSALWAEFAILVVIFVTLFYTHGGKWVPDGFNPPVADYGFMVVDATKLLFVEHQNPYSSQTISPIRDILTAEYRGYYYGPLTMIGYLPSLWWPYSGYKIAGVFFLIVCAILLAFLVIEPDEPLSVRLANIAFVETAFFLPERMWIELFSRGSHDFMPVAFILAALLALKKDAYFWVGLLAGLSFSTKFSPALFLLPFLPIRQKKMWIGLAIGMAPQIPFLLWDFTGYFNNVFLVRFIMPSDGSSLRYFIKPEHYWWLPACVIVGMALSFYRNLRKQLEYRTVLVGFTLLLIVGEVTFKQVHLNHLVWFFPMFALIFTYNRERLFGFLSRGDRLAEA